MDPASERRERMTRRIVPAVVALAVLAVGVVLGRASAPSPAEVRTARARADAADDRVARVAHERDRLRTERDQLEARLAAGRAPATCPEEFVSTGSSIPGIAFDYPCGWHVVNRDEPARPAAGSEEDQTAGLLANITLLSRLPVSLVARSGPFADVELVVWRDDPSDDEDRTRPVSAWLERERSTFARIAREDSFEAGAGTTVYRLTGTLAGDDPAPATVLLWDVPGPSTAVARVFALRPNARVVRALDRLARSFRASS